ncbi:VCBS domain-containing protein, partial [Vulcanococcus limneticus]|uniref:VCBS domain-containing protein n=1 Tax=Vulcanococcus limneticus TaxID=2170428 RepID=UPI00398C0A46
MEALPPDVVLNPGIVAERGLVDAGAEGLASTTGTITIFDPDGINNIATVTIAGTVLTIPQLSALSPTSPVTISLGDESLNDGDDQPEGQLILTAFDGTTGVISFTYQLLNPPDNSFNNPNINGDNALATLSVVVTDLSGLSSQASGTILIIDDLPTAVSDTASVDEDRILVVDAQSGLLANDSPGADGFAATAIVGITQGTNSGASPIGGVGVPLQSSYGTLTLQSDGAYTYIPDSSNPLVQQLASGESITDTYTYSLTDRDGDISTATLTVTITGTNDGPSIGDVANFGFTEATDAAAQDLTASGTVSFADIDTNDVV